LCRQYIWGVGKIGYRCKVCAYVCHKRCVHEVPNNCPPRPMAATSILSMSSVEAAAKQHAKEMLENDNNLQPNSPIKVKLEKPPNYNEGVVSDDYILGDELGSGGCATVYLGVNRKTQEKVAIKKLDKSGFELALLERELRIMDALEHPAIVRLLAAYKSPKFVDLVLELVTGGELFDAIVERGTFSESNACFVMKQLLDGIAYCHQRGVAHRDLKAENILIADKAELKVKIADFGLANVLGTTANLVTACGTPDYVAPEILQGLPYGPEVDLWSLGILAYILMCGYPPFWGENQTDLFKRIIECQYVFTYDDWEEISDTGVNFVTKLLIGTPEDRMTARQALHHPWFVVGEAQLNEASVGARASVRNLADYVIARKSGSANYVPLAMSADSSTPRQSHVAQHSPAVHGILSPLGASQAKAPSPHQAGTNSGSSSTTTTTTTTHSSSDSPSRLPYTPVGSRGAAAFGPGMMTPGTPGPRISSSTESSSSNGDDEYVHEDNGKDTIDINDNNVDPSNALRSAMTKSEETESEVLYYSPNNLTDMYDLGEEIGRGGCAVVYKATDKKTNELWAVKRLDKRSFELRLLQRELAIMRRLKHPNILLMQEAFDSEKYVDLVVEFVDGGELFDAVVARGGLAEVDCARIVAQILSALDYMHCQDPPVAHRDLKAENVLVSADLQMIKIADFGLSNVMESSARLRTSCGTPDYVAPEVLKAQGYGVEVDIWSTGVLTYIMLCGYPPFYDKSQNALFKRILIGEFKFPSREWMHTTKSARRFVRHVLVVDPTKRPTARDCLQHEWFKVHEQATSTLSKQVRRGNSVANLRVYQKGRKATTAEPARRRPDAVVEASESSYSDAPLLYPLSVNLENYYTLNHEIGRGSTASVWLATENQTNTKWAVKRVDRKLIDPLVLERELAIMADCRHENILRLRAVYQSDNVMDLVIEYAGGGELFDLVVERERFTERDAKHVMRQIMSGLTYLHKRGIAHRDIKAENILIAEEGENINGPITVKIADFGLSNVLGTSVQLETSCGTPDYVAPEVLRGEGYDLAVDVWSAGVLTYIILAGFPPFYDERGEMFLFRKIMNVEFSFDDEEWENVSNDARDFITRLLVSDPVLRYTAQQALHHRWLSNDNDTVPVVKPSPSSKVVAVPPAVDSPPTSEVFPFVQARSRAKKKPAGGAASSSVSATSESTSAPSQKLKSSRERKKEKKTASGQDAPLASRSKLSQYRRRRRREREKQRKQLESSGSSEKAKKPRRKKEKKQRSQATSTAAPVTPIHMNTSTRVSSPLVADTTPNDPTESIDVSANASSTVNDNNEETSASMSSRKKEKSSGKTKSKRKKTKDSQ